MIVSHKWLQRFFTHPLPSAEEMADKLTFGAFEIEGIAKNGDDTVIDVKVLPDRACYALSHRGIAREVATLIGAEMKDPLCMPYPKLEPKSEQVTLAVDAARCPFYAAAHVMGITVGPSPEWLKEFLEAIGQKSINNIVDATNFVMFNLGTPLHAFDADKLSGAIGVRAAKDGEKIMLLGSAEKTLTSEMTVITDAKADIPIAIAGVKGGAHAELTSGTKNIIIEAAKFDPVRTRRTATALNLKTDASKRFENNMAIELPAYGLAAVVDLILEIAGGDSVRYATTDVRKKNPYKLGTSVSDVNQLLGTKLTEQELTVILNMLGFAYERIEDPVAYAQNVATSLVGAAYKADSAIQYDAPEVFSCSAFTNYAYVQAGITLPSVSIDQYLWGDAVAENEVRAGDLIFLNSGTGKIWYESPSFLPKKKVPEGIDHVGLCLGDGKFIHASQTLGSVVIEQITDAAKRAKVIGYRRIQATAPRFVITTPFERLDLRIPQDIIEEVARVYGYANIAPQALPEVVTRPEPNPRWCAAECIRNALGELGFMEVYTYTLRDDGAVKLANALAADKSTLRASLAPGIREALDKNAYNAPLMGLEVVKIFEIGNVFSEKSESQHVCVAVRALSKKWQNAAQASFDDARAALESHCKVTLHQKGDELVLEFALPKHTECPTLPLIARGATYVPPSPYPFILRDISLWVPDTDEARSKVIGILGEFSAGLLKHVILFDQFKKEGRNSLAFHLVFQSDSKTLSDDEVNVLMGNIQTAMQGEGWEVR